MSKKSSIYLFCLLPLISVAQNFILKGKVVDEKNYPISFSNVVLYSTENLTYIEGAITNEEGLFKFENLKGDNYTIIISYLGFEENKITVTLDKSKNVGAIVLKEKIESLDGVTVVAKRPTIKRMVDRLVFNVENSTLSNSNMLDVLKHTPGVLVYDGKITVKQSATTVYVNDRRLYLSPTEILQLLESTSATNIKSIEVITNPPAKYEAEGGAILNIITSKNIIDGYNGSVFGNYKQGSQYPKYAFGTSHFFKTKNLSTDLSYNISPKKEFRNNNESINFIENNKNTSSWQTNFKRTSETQDQNINANIDYRFNHNNSLTFSTNILVSPTNNTKKMVNSLTEVYNSINVLDSTFNTINSLENKVFNVALTLDYVHKFKKEGEKLLVSVHQTNYDYSSFQDVKTGYFLPKETIAFRNNNFQTFSKQIIRLYTGQLDYELPINSTAFFETGLKVSKINSDNKFKQYFIYNSMNIDDLHHSDTFIYKEFNYAAYASYSKDWDYWSLKLGLRNEFTDIVGNSLSTSSINKNNYIKLFPSMHILSRLNENNDIYFNYNKRIYRPNYNELNPFKYFLNDNAYITGDPNLKPQIDDVFTLGYTFNKDYSFEVYYIYKNNPTLQITFQDNNDKILKIINTNINKSITYGLDFTMYTKIAKRWNLYIMSSLFYYENHFVALESDNLFTKNKKWSFYTNVINYFSFFKNESLTADIAFLYISPIFDGSEQVSVRQGLDFNLRKTLFKEHASISIGLTDVFNTQNFTSTNKYLNQDMFLISRLENRLFTFGFNYKFGNSNIKSSKKEIEIEERDRLNTKNN